ncbi:hypothetical protein [Streptomyces sp. NPDC059262]|uniref:hypothetical protein n=1 Tax=Streptomyces sp. NPDC059262 TaxID=3346797 RepID=UPI0036B67322
MSTPDRSGTADTDMLCPPGRARAGTEPNGGGSEVQGEPTPEPGATPGTGPGRYLMPSSRLRSHGRRRTRVLRLVRREPELLARQGLVQTRFAARLDHAGRAAAAAAARVSAQLGWEPRP